MTAIIFILFFLFFLIIGIPIAFVLGLSSINDIILLGELKWLIAVPQRIFVGLDNFVLLAIPFYILAGNLMNSCGITKRLIKFFQIILGHIRGALAYINVLASMLFAGITGTATADTAAIGGIMIPAMEEDGYTPEFSAAVTVASSMIGPIIPPSMVMIMYSIMAGTSIAEMFLGGIVPGIILGIAQMILVYFYAKKNKFPASERISTPKEIVIGFRDAIFALIMPLIIIGGILSGIFTATEAGAMAVLYSLIVGFFVYKELKLNDLPEIFFKTAKSTAAIMLIVGTGQLFAWLMAIQMIPQQVVEVITTITSNKILVLLLLNILLLFVGTFMETLASLIILTPVLVPMVTHLGVDPVHFGVLMTINLTFGLMTPPLGVCLFIGSSIAEISFEQLVMKIWPFLLVNIIVLLLITYVPELTLFLPNLFY